MSTETTAALLPSQDSNGLGEFAQCCWFGPGGALITDAPVEGLTLAKMSPVQARFYGGSYLIAESMSFSTAQRIAAALGLRFKGSRY